MQKDWSRLPGIANPAERNHMDGRSARSREYVFGVPAAGANYGENVARMTAAKLRCADNLCVAERCVFREVDGHGLVHPRIAHGNREAAALSGELFQRRNEGRAALHAELLQLLDETHECFVVIRKQMLAEVYLAVSFAPVNA